MWQHWGQEKKKKGNYLQPGDLTGFTPKSVTITLWESKIPHFHLQFMAALIHLAGNCFGYKYEHRTVTPKWLDSGISIIFLQ